MAGMVLDVIAGKDKELFTWRRQRHRQNSMRV
jgi:hypothetical protein